MSFGTFFKRKTKIREKSQIPVLFPEINSIKNDMIYTSTGIIFSTKGNEDQLDNWAAEQAKKVDLEKRYVESHKTKKHPTITCKGCGAPVTTGYKCNYCGNIYSNTKVIDEDKVTAEDIAEAIWNTPLNYEKYEKYWEQVALGRNR